MNLIRKGFDRLLSFGCIILETIGIKCFFFFPLKDNTTVAFSHFSLSPPRCFYMPALVSELINDIVYATFFFFFPPRSVAETGRVCDSSDRRPTWHAGT